MGKRTGNKVVPEIMAIITFSLIVIGCIFQRQNTLVEWWKPVAISLLPSGAMGILLSKVMSRLTKINNMAINCLCGLLFSFAILYGGFHILNFCFSTTDAREQISATVINKYSEEHYQPRMVSRNFIVRGHKYMEYKLTLRLPDGKTKNMKVSVSQYRKIRNRETLQLEIQKGMFGVPVIKDMKIPDRYQKRKNRTNIYYRKRL